MKLLIGVFSLAHSHGRVEQAAGRARPVEAPSQGDEVRGDFASASAAFRRWAGCEACAGVKRVLSPVERKGSRAVDTEPTSYAAIGGADAVDALVERFYTEMDRLPEARGVRALHADNLGPTRRLLKLYLSEWLGGPALYSALRGHPRLRMRHIRFPIGEAERDAWLLCMSAALNACVADEAVRQGVYAAMAGLADHMRNKPG